MPAKGNGSLQTLTCVLVVRPRQCPSLSNPVPWQNSMAAYLGYTLQTKTLFRGWPIMAHDMHTRRRRMTQYPISRYCVPVTGYLISRHCFHYLHFAWIHGFPTNWVPDSSSLVRYPAMGADHPLPPECHDDQQRLEDAKFSRDALKDWVNCERQTASGREFQSVMARGKNEYLK